MGFSESVDRICIPLINRTQYMFGYAMVIGLWILVTIHVYAYFTFIIGLLMKRLGTLLAMVWFAIGLSLLFNILWNHTLAMLIKPGAPND